MDFKAPKNGWEMGGQNWESVVLIEDGEDEMFIHTTLLNIVLDNGLSLIVLLLLSDSVQLFFTFISSNVFSINVRNI